MYLLLKGDSLCSGSGPSVELSSIPLEVTFLRDRSKGLRRLFRRDR